MLGRYGVILDAGSSVSTFEQSLRITSLLWVLADWNGQGTRLHIYKWLDTTTARKGASSKELHSLPVLATEKKWTKKVHKGRLISYSAPYFRTPLIKTTGVSTFGETPDQVGPKHLKDLLRHALDIVPEDAVKDTPLFLLATAGMRLLPESQRTKLLTQICSYARSETKFQIPECDLHIQVLPGETEGLYGWIAVNYLLGGFDSSENAHGKDHHTYGFLDMGGASAQIAFAPNQTESVKHAEDLKLLRVRKLDGVAAEFRVFVTSWLGFGVNEARRRYVDGLLKANQQTRPKGLYDPCLPAGLSITTKGDVFLPGPKTVAGKTPYLIGSGHFDQCLNQTFPLLEKDAICEDEPCLLNGVHVPAIDFDVNHFVGVSEYWHTTHEIFEKEHQEKAYDLNTYQHRVNEFCSMDWKTIQKGIENHSWGKKVSKETAIEVCFKASWLINILHEGIGIPRVGLENTQGGDLNGTQELLHNAKEKGFTDSFRAVNKISDTEVSWTLGKMVLYASSQIPSLTDDSPVGFGNNTVSGVPVNFQLAGSTLSTSSPPTKITPSNSTATSLPHSNSSSGEDDWHDTLFGGQSPRRIPGLLLFILILCFAALLLCGRDRRKSLYRKLFRRSSHSNSQTHIRYRKRKFSPPFKVPFFGSSGSSNGSGAYERVLEDGTGADRFELDSAVDAYDDSEGERADNEHSDDSTGSWTGKSSGWATPRIVGGNGNGKGIGEYFDSVGSKGNVAGGGNANTTVGLGILARSGLVGRTESRERLAGMTVVAGEAGRRSRRASPVRGGRGPLGVLSED